MKFEIISKIEQTETIAKGTCVDIRHLLNTQYGRHNWRKMKGIAVIEIAVIEYMNGQVWLAEIH